MKVVALLVIVAGLLYARDAHAIAACNNNYGLAPHVGAELPPRPRLLLFNTSELRADGYAAKINGKYVPVKVEVITSGPHHMVLLQIESDAVGTLRVFQQSIDSSRKKKIEEWELGRYKIKAKAKLPAKLKAEPRRLHVDIPHSTVKEEYKALVLDLGERVPAILATVNLRRDAQSKWQRLQLPVSPGDWMDKRTTVRLGQIGCKTNFAPELLEQGVDIELSVTLADGTMRDVELPPHVVLPSSSPSPSPSP